MPYSPEFVPSQESGRELADLLRASGGRERVAIEETWNDLPKRLRAFPLTPIFCIAALVLFLLEVAERRFALIGRLFPAKQKKKPAPGEGPASAMTGKAPRKRRKAAKKPAPGKGTSDAASSRETPSDAQESAPEQEPSPADSISAALKKARRR